MILIVKKQKLGYELHSRIMYKCRTDWISAMRHSNSYMAITDIKQYAPVSDVVNGLVNY